VHIHTLSAKLNADYISCASMRTRACLLPDIPCIWSTCTRTNLCAHERKYLAVREAAHKCKCWVVHVPAHECKYWAVHLPAHKCKCWAVRVLTHECKCQAVHVHAHTYNCDEMLAISRCAGGFQPYLCFTGEECALLSEALPSVAGRLSAREKGGLHGSVYVFGFLYLPANWRERKTG